MSSGSKQFHYYEYIRDLMEDRVKTSSRGWEHGLTEKTAENLSELNEMIENDEVGSQSHLLAKKAGYILYDLIGEFGEEMDDELEEEIEELVLEINSL